MYSLGISTLETKASEVNVTLPNMEDGIYCPNCGSKNVRLYVASGFKSMLNVDIFGNKIEDGEDYICDFCSHKFKK